MSELTGAEFLTKKLKEQYDIAVGQVVRGQAEYEYRRLVGVLQGLNYAIDLVRDLEKRMAENEEFDFNE
jgi:hypothetical protein